MGKCSYDGDQIQINTPKYMLGEKKKFARVYRSLVGKCARTMIVISFTLNDVYF